MRELRLAGVGASARKPFEGKLTRILSGKPSGELVEELAIFFRDREESGGLRWRRRDRLENLDAYRDAFCKYVRRAIKADLSEPQLLAACEFLRSAEEWSLLE